MQRQAQEGACKSPPQHISEKLSRRPSGKTQVKLLDNVVMISSAALPKSASYNYSVGVRKSSDPLWNRCFFSQNTEILTVANGKQRGCGGSCSAAAVVATLNVVPAGGGGNSTSWHCSKSQAPFWSFDSPHCPHQLEDPGISVLV